MLSWRGGGTAYGETLQASLNRKVLIRSDLSAYIGVATESASAVVQPVRRRKRRDGSPLNDRSNGPPSLAARCLRSLHSHMLSPGEDDAAFDQQAFGDAVSRPLPAFECAHQP
jgi:hypothetical protein